MKAHIINAPAPVQEHSDLEAVCGETVKNAEFLMIWQQHRIRPDLDAPDWCGVCRKCVKVQLEHNHVYLAANGQEIRVGGDL